MQDLTRTQALIKKVNESSENTQRVEQKVNVLSGVAKDLAEQQQRFGEDLRAYKLEQHVSQDESSKRLLATITSMLQNHFAETQKLLGKVLSPMSDPIPESPAARQVRAELSVVRPEHATNSYNVVGPAPVHTIRTPRRQRRLFSSTPVPHYAPPNWPRDRKRQNEHADSTGHVSTAASPVEARMSPEARGLYRTSPLPPSPSLPIADCSHSAEPAAFDLFEDLPMETTAPHIGSPHRLPPRLSPPMERYLVGPSAINRDASVSRASITSGSASKRIMGPEDFDRRRFQLGMGNRVAHLGRMGFDGHAY